MKAKDPLTADASTEPSPDEFVSLSLVKWHMKVYPMPVSLSNPQYVVAPETWPYMLLHLRVPWSDIQTDHATPGPLTLALKDALTREFSVLGASATAEITSAVDGFIEIAETVIHFQVSRGPVALLGRLERMMKRTQAITTALISRRLDAEVGAGVGESYSVQTTILNPARYPVAAEGVVLKLKKHTATRPTKTTRGTPRIVSKGDKKRSTATLECEFCGDKVTNYRSHNNVCRARVGAVKKQKGK